MSERDAANAFDPRNPRRSPSRPRPAWWVLLTLYWLLFPPPTYAYIDPGTGSYILQVVIAGLLGALVSLRIYWARIKAFLKGNPPLGGNDPDKHE
ncbi:MAG: hypothetical protein OXI69_13160 [Acidobacteriota bacterium]|nr:hypothetical protein [Acidobacteriota bacterium]